MTYRITGLNGEATEETIDNLVDDNEVLALTSPTMGTEAKKEYEYNIYLYIMLTIQNLKLFFEPYVIFFS